MVTSTRPVEMVAGLAQEERALIVKWGDGRESKFHYIWLRDNCPSPESLHPNGQRLLETASIPPGIRPRSVQLTGTGDVEITWANDGHTSRFSPAWLRAYDYTWPRQMKPQKSLKLWDATLSDTLPASFYQEVAADQNGLKTWLGLVETYGVAILYGAPAVPATVTQIVELFGYVRETNYGRLFDVKSVTNPNNLAYTGLALSPHTDNPYRDPVPTLQLLHCLSSSVEGGESIIVDGFKVADTMRQQEPDQFNLLASTQVRFRFQDQEADLTAEAPIITLNTQGEVTAIRFNNRSIGPFNFEPDLMERFYEAYGTFTRMLNEPKFQVCFKLAAGDLFMVDNQRVLHGRTGFASSGSRHLQGCYADRDGLYSRLRVLERAG